MKDFFDNRLKQNLFLICAGILFASILININMAIDILGKFIGLFTPLIIGGAIAFVLNVPMSFFEKKLAKMSAHRTTEDKAEESELFGITDHENHLHEVLDELEEEFEKGKSKRITVISLLLTLAIIIALIFVLVAVIVPNLADSVRSIIYYVTKMYPTWVDMLSSHGISSELINEYLGKLDIASFLSKLSDTSGDFITLVSNKVGTVFGAAANTVVGIVFAIYILLDKKNIGRKTKKFVYSYCKPKIADELYEIAKLSYKTFAKFLSGQGLEAVILGTIFCVVLAVGRFPYAVSIATIIGMLSLIPIVGAFIGMAFGVLLISVVSFKKALIFIVVFIIVQQIEGNLIYPKVVGGSVGLPAIWTLLAVLIGGNVAGIIGCICFIPIFSIIYVLIERDLNKRFNRKRELKKGIQE